MSWRESDVMDIDPGHEPRGDPASHRRGPLRSEGGDQGAGRSRGDNDN